MQYHVLFTNGVLVTVGLIGFFHILKWDKPRIVAWSIADAGFPVDKR